VLLCCPPARRGAAHPALPARHSAWHLVSGEPSSVLRFLLDCFVITPASSELSVTVTSALCLIHASAELWYGFMPPPVLPGFASCRDLSSQERPQAKTILLSRCGFANYCTTLPCPAAAAAAPWVLLDILMRAEVMKAE
jgi:hypothetical protein